MFARLFGETEAEQLSYLKPRVFLTAALVVVDIVLIFFTGPVGISVLSCYIWGWGALKSLFGFATLGVIFSRNVVLAAVFIVAFLMLGALAGFVCMFLGVGRFIYLMASRTAARR